MMQALDLVIRPSRCESMLVLGSYGGAALVCAMLALSRPVVGLLLVMLSVPAVRAWRHARRSHPRAIDRLRFLPDGDCRWRQAGDGGWVEGRCVEALTLGDALVVLTLEPYAAGRRRRCIVFRDATDPAHHRRLRARLRVAPPRDAREATN